jgi:hypothetical protein
LDLQTQSDLFQCVGQADGEPRPHRVKRAHFGENSAQVLFCGVLWTEALFVGRAGDDGFDGRVTAPQVGAAQSANSGHFHEDRFLLFFVEPIQAAGIWP